MSELVQRRKAMAEELMRDAICEAATGVLAKVGFTALTMEQVAEAAGVSKGTLYNYFQDKDTLFVEVIDRAFAVVAAGVDAALAGGGSPRVVLGTVVALLLKGVEMHRELGQVVRSNQLPPRLAAAIRAKKMRVREHLVGVLRQAQAVGELRRDSPTPETLGRFLALVMDGIVDERMLHGDECPPLAAEIGLIEALVLRQWFVAPTEDAVAARG